MKQVVCTTHTKYFLLDGERFFFVNLNAKTYAIPDKCPHRGGPLSLGELCEVNQTIQCPWHDNVVKLSVLIKHAIPAIRVSNKLFYL